jgi:hypothetical protein
MTDIMQSLIEGEQKYRGAIASIFSWNIRSFYQPKAATLREHWEGNIPAIVLIKESLKGQTIGTKTTHCEQSSPPFKAARGIFTALYK